MVNTDIKEHETLETLTVNEKHVSQKCVTIAPVAPFSIDSSEFSSITKIFRVTALAMRFIKLLKNVQCENGFLQSVELNDAELLWLTYVQKKYFQDEIIAISKGNSTNLQRQLGLYMDSEGLLRCRGRLENSDLSEGARCPIMLPRTDRLTHLIIEKIHKQSFHCGVSQTLARLRYKYWIPQGRATIRSILRSCTVCRRCEGGPYPMPPMASLPRSRVEKSSPFSRTGLDYFGPLYIKSSEGIKKVWVCLFTCMVTRAIHLELVQDMTAEEFLLGFKRFVSQRGVPAEIISDNASQFKVASKTLEMLFKRVLKHEDIQSYVSNSGINWKFIVELAPWMGGFYERLVGIVKRSLRKSLGRRMLTLIQLQTLLKEIESVVNSRPLVYIDEDINSNITLTPGHFLSINPKTGIPQVDIDQDEDYYIKETTSERLVKLWKRGQKLLDQFWKLWRDEYLASLRERTQYLLRSPRIKSPFKPNIGDVVLIKDNVPRGCWKTGRICELITSRDGKIRSVKLRLPSGNILGRPLKLLYPLECSGNTEIKQNIQSKTNSSEDHKDRPVRKSAQDAKRKIKEQILQQDSD